MPVVDFSKASYSLSIGGQAMKLTNLSLVFGFNVPPCVRGLAVPAALVDKKVVKASDVSQFWEAYRQADASVGKESVNLSIAGLGPDNESNFNASGWVLASADVSASAEAGDGGNEISFSALHPICNLQRYPANVGPVSPSPSYADVEGEDFLAVVKSAIDVYLANASSATMSQPGYKLMVEGRAKLSEYLDCTASLGGLASMFAGLSSPENVKNGFRKYILSCIESGGENSSMWDLVVGSLAATLSLRLCMDPGDLSAHKLFLKPSVPYTSKKVSIATKDISSIYNATGPWLKCTGLSTWAPAPTGLAWNAEHGYNSDPFVPSAYCSVAATSNMLQMCNVNLPGWFEAVVGHCEPPSYNAPQNAGDFIDLETMESIISDVACKRLLTQQFLDLYRQSTSIAVTKVFSFKGDGGLLIPGITCEISDGGLLFNISEVEHSFNMSGKTASTTIRGNYVRGSDFSVTVEGAENPGLITSGFSGDFNYIWR